MAEAKIAFYKRQLELLDKANAAPRCGKIYVDGTQCGCPRMKTGRLCYAHQRMEEVRPRKLKLLVMEDANCVILNIATLTQALLEGTISTKEAGLLFYGTQTAAGVLPQVTFRQTNPGEMVTELPATGSPLINTDATDQLQRTQRNTEKLAAEVETASINGNQQPGQSDEREEQPGGISAGMAATEPAQPGAAAPHEHEANDASAAAGEGACDAQSSIAGDELNMSFGFGDDGIGEGDEKIGPSGCRDIGSSGVQEGVA